MRVLLLTGTRDYHRYVASRLADRVDLVHVVIEDASLRKQAKVTESGFKERLRNRAPKLFGALSSLKGLATKSAAERRTPGILQDLERRAHHEFVAAAGGEHDWPAVPRQQVPRVNGKAVVERCKELAPDVTLVFGTSILKLPMIQVAKVATLNAHTSLLPDFRGTSSEFWQVHHDRLDCAGVTVHYIDEGVDTGDVLLQQATRIDGRADPYRLRFHNVLMVPELFATAVEALGRGDAPRLRQGTSELPTYRTRDLTLERQIEMLRTMGYEV